MNGPETRTNGLAYVFNICIPQKLRDTTVALNYWPRTMRPMNMFREPLAALIALLLLSGCSGIAMRLGDSLSAGILNHDDPETVETALPAYLIMLDGLIENAPDSKTLLRTGAELYSAYAGSFVDDNERQLILANRARNYGRRAICHSLKKFCPALDSPYQEFAAALVTLDDTDDLPWLFAWASASATWIQANTSDYAALAEIPKVNAAIKHIVDLDPEFENGQPWLFLGVLATQIPPSAGGKPEEGRRYFERSIALSDDRNLFAKTLFARFYARLVFDQELHDRLLNEVIAADAVAPKLTLANVLAKRQARELLASSADYF